jgi:hypothetical protein
MLRRSADCVKVFHMSERTINFDTHRFVKRLVESGLAEKTAEVLADKQSRLLTENLVTKTDLKTALANTEAKLMRWMAGLLIAQGGVIVTLVGLLG